MVKGDMYVCLYCGNHIKSRQDEVPSICGKCKTRIIVTLKRYNEMLIIVARKKHEKADLGLNESVADFPEFADTKFWITRMERLNRGAVELVDELKKLGEILWV